MTWKNAADSPSSDPIKVLRTRLLSLWTSIYLKEDLPAAWQAQVEVWAADDVTPRDLSGFFTAWEAKPRLESPATLWRYLQVCCFNKTHPGARRSQSGTRRQGSGWYEESGRDVYPSGEPSWFGRDPGTDVA